MQGFTSDEITVDNIQRQLGQDRRDNDDLIDIGGNGFYAVVEVRARQNRRALMHGFNDAFHRHAFCCSFTRTPDHAVTGYQRADGAANIAAVNLAITRFHISMHTEAANHYAFSGFAKQVVVVIDLLRSGFKTALVIGFHAALLPFGEFIFTQSCWLLVAHIGQNLYDTH